MIRRGRTDRHHPFKMGYVGSSPAAGTIRRVGRTARHLPCKKDDGISEFSPGSRLACDVTEALKVLILPERVRIFPGQPFERIRSRGVKPAVPEGTRKKIWGRDPPLGNEISNSRRKLFGASKEVSVGPDPFFFSSTPVCHCEGPDVRTASPLRAGFIEPEADSGPKHVPGLS